MMSWKLDDEIEAVLKRIQRFDPVGVAARDLKVSVNSIVLDISN